MLTAVALTAALAAPASADGHRFAVSLAQAGPRPAASAAERRAHARVRSAFAASGLRVGVDVFEVPGRGSGRSRNVVGVWDAPASCLDVVMAHTDSMPATEGAEDNASGVGVVVALAARMAVVRTRCDVWLVATGAEERLYTGRPDHLGASALVRRVRRLGRSRDLRLALSLDEVGRGTRMVLRSSAARPRASVERRIVRAGPPAGLRVTWRRDGATGSSDHREFQLAGFPAAKLGLPGNPCRHEPCDTASRLTASTFPRVRGLVERLLTG